ncbi:aldose epimerase family protein [Garciella nitratireducens]|uniref:aldose epimerase family protein n=1 Tax=Garciella nitratireducens TaxID=218205 RepID=UPI001BD2E9B0|nr:aldose epimerase family protein [Garciella nitratireducens]
MDILTKILDKDWKLYILKNDFNMEVHILNYGGIIQKILFPDKNGNFENMVLGYKNYEDYKKDSNFFGALIGRVAGRIQMASFCLDGKDYVLEKNDGQNHLHGGSNGFHRVIWKTEPFQEINTIGVKLSYFSKDGENGYPGNMQVEVRYSLNDQNQLIIDYKAFTDQKTPVTLTNHTYFNLSGDLKNTIENHSITMNSHCYLELNQELIPTGKVVDATNTPFDFQKGRKLKDGIYSPLEQNKIVGNGYDHYFIFDWKKKGDVYVEEPLSGRTMTIQTNQPGMVIYTGNHLQEGLALNEAKSKKHLGVCFETQTSPLSLHHPEFPSIFLKEDQIYHKQTVFTFFT